MSVRLDGFFKRNPDQSCQLSVTNTVTISVRQLAYSIVGLQCQSMASLKCDSYSITPQILLDKFRHLSLIQTTSYRETRVKIRGRRRRAQWRRRRLHRRQQIDYQKPQLYPCCLHYDQLYPYLEDLTIADHLINAEIDLTT